MHNKILLRKINKHYLIIFGLIIITLIKIYMTSNLPIYYNVNLKYDDALMINQAVDLTSGNYLGKYSHLTLAKGIFYPLFIAILNICKIPYLVGLSLFYIGSIIIFTCSLFKIINNKYILYFIYLFLLLNPLSFSLMTFQKIYRNSLMSSLVFYLFGFLILLYKSYKQTVKKSILIAFFLGLFYFFITNTREDTMWFIPCFLIIFITAIYDIIKIKQYKKILLFIIPIITYLSFNNLLCFINYKNYNIYTTNELSGTNYSKAFLKILSIKDERSIEKVSIHPNTYIKLAKISPNFNILYNKLKEVKNIESLYLHNSVIIWVLREYAYLHGYYDNSMKAEKFWYEIANDIEYAFNNGTFEKEYMLPSVFLVPFNKEDIPILVKETFNTLLYVLSYEDIETKIAYSNISNQDAAIKILFNSHVVHGSRYKEENLNTYLKMDTITNIFNKITYFYKLIIPILSIISFITFLYCFIKEGLKTNIIGIILFLSFSLIIIGITYTHVMTFEARTYYYLAPVYSVLLCFISIYIEKIYSFIRIMWYTKKGDDMKLLDGKEVKKYLIENFEKDASECCLAIIQVGNNPESTTYVNTKRKVLESLNIGHRLIKLDENITEEEVLSIVDDLNVDDSITGILVQMPLPNHLDSRKIVNRIDASKDVDGLTDTSLDLLKDNEATLVSPTALSVLALLDYYKINVEGKNVVIIGRSKLVGKPLEYLMLHRNASVTVCHSKTENVPDITRQADILISATGKKHLVTADMVKDGSVIVDVGIIREDNKIYGDIDFENVKEKASYITPVPGGVGQVVSLMLAQNVVKAKKNEQRFNKAKKLVYTK